MDLETNNEAVVLEVQTPDVVEAEVQNVEVEINSIIMENVTVSATTKAEGTNADVTKSVQDGQVHLNFGIPRGNTGATGATGQAGADGYSPTANVSKVGSTATITITDKNGTSTANVTDGADGNDGYSPSATVSKVGKVATITITDEDGTTTATVSDGNDGAKGDTGDSGYSPSASVSKVGKIATITITDEDGTTTATVSDGEDGASDWNDITNKPSTFPPSSHNHDDRYYTESETDALLGNKANSSTLTSHTSNTNNPHNVKANQVRMPSDDEYFDNETVQQAADELYVMVNGKQNEITSSNKLDYSLIAKPSGGIPASDLAESYALASSLTSHEDNIANPHAVNASQVKMTNSSTHYASERVQDCINALKTITDNESSSISAINGKIPAQATSQNQLADKSFVNSSINSITAFYITRTASGDQFATYAQLASATTFYSGGEVRVPTRNDYCIVQVDENHDDATTRYIYQNDQWEYQYTVNETALTSDQLAAINSGITSSKVSTYDGYASQIISLGETSSTAYRGDRGKDAYDHSQTNMANPHGTRAHQIIMPRDDAYYDGQTVQYCVDDLRVRADSKYVKPSDGIPDSDIASALTWNAKQSALSTAQLNACNSGITSSKVSTYDGYATTIAGKQDAISDLSTIRDNASSGASKVSCTDATVGGFGYTKNTGTITGITMNGASKGTSGVVNLGTVLTAHQDISGKEDKGKVTISGTQYNVSSVPLVITFDDSTTTTYNLLVRG